MGIFRPPAHVVIERSQGNSKYSIHFESLYWEQSLKIGQNDVYYHTICILMSVGLLSFMLYIVKKKKLNYKTTAMLEWE